MFCRKCGMEISETARFCGKCGEPVQQPKDFVRCSGNTPGVLNVPGAASNRAAKDITIMLLVAAVLPLFQIIFLFTSGFTAKYYGMERTLSLSECLKANDFGFVIPIGVIASLISVVLYLLPFFTGRVEKRKMMIFQTAQSAWNLLWLVVMWAYASAEYERICTVTATFGSWMLLILCVISISLNANIVMRTFFKHALAKRSNKETHIIG